MLQATIPVLVIQTKAVVAISSLLKPGPLLRTNWFAGFLAMVAVLALQLETELLSKITNEAAPDIREIRPDLPASLTRLIARALGKLSQNRYPEGAQLARKLRAIFIEPADEAPAAAAMVATAPHEPSQSGASAMHIKIWTNSP